MTKQEVYKGQRSILVMVIGESGRGKSRALINMPPEATVVIDVVGKPLPFIGAGAKFKRGENIFTLSEALPIIQKIEEVSRNKPTVEHVVIDDGQYIMATEFMAKANVKGYDKFTIMADNMWKILRVSANQRDGMKVFLLCHEEQEEGQRHMKTLGKLLKEKLTPEGLSTIVLFAEAVKSGSKTQYYFSTQTDGVTTAKSPEGMFPERIPNDLWLVSQRIDEYYMGVPLEQSKLNFEVK